MPWSKNIPGPLLNEINEMSKNNKQICWRFFANFFFEKAKYFINIVWLIYKFVFH